MPKAPAITNRILLQHIQGMRTAVETRLECLEKDVKSLKTDVGVLKIDVGVMKIDVGVLKKDIVFVKDALQRLYTHRVNMLVRIQKLESVVGIQQQPS
ncbi:MAG: hypothetical protein Greene041662_857 [Candidatus Peregrinibacteria bacterium Greene0416_62]|nr:MAG: hypothetical protein Greene041662_857 [Candidatus Peregrinibacteria bacterium Greene0416_62]TSD00745.1 MAG: hypothetical protein Greene101449_8 [Candidatus Peregrinibacteria bacterium Greene1014_49]